MHLISFFGAPLDTTMQLFVQRLYALLRSFEFFYPNHRTMDAFDRAM